MWILGVMYVLLIPCAILFIHTKHKIKGSAPLTVALKAASTTIIVLAAIVGVAWIREPMQIYAILVAGGLVLGLVGDIVICQPEPGGFLSGMIYFALGHLCYIGAFLRISTHILWAVPAFLVIYGIFLTVLIRLAKKIGNLLVPTAIYGAIIATMVSMSVTIPFSVPQGYILLAAALLFAVSDGLLAYNTFIKIQTTNHTLDWISLCCYFAGQSLFAVSIFCL